MNRSILIVICDFLLVSLLIFSTPDLSKINQDEETQTNVVAKTELVTNAPDSSQDLTAVMRQALDEEKKSREKLQAELLQTRAQASEREQQVEKVQQQLLAREQQVQNFQQELQAREQQAAELKQQQDQLQQQFAAAQTNISTLSQKLHSTAEDAVMSKEQLAALNAEMQKQVAQANALKQQLGDLQKSNQVAQVEKEHLSNQLQVAQVEKQNALQQATQMEGLVKVERQEKAKLAEGVLALANKSGALAQEIHQSQPLAPNTIFSDFLTNRVQADFTAVRPGLLGEATKQDQTETVLVNDGTNTFALCHVTETPLTLWTPGTDWDSLTGILTHSSARIPIHSVSFGWPDPRIVLIPLTSAEVKQLDTKVYSTSSDPFKFQDAVLIGTHEAYYGECKFGIDLSTPGYLKLDRSVLKGLFGKFNPSRGDLVFSRTGELLGVMANGTYCMMIRKFETAASVQFGQDIASQHTGNTLSRLYTYVSNLPQRLQ